MVRGRADRSADWALVARTSPLSAATGRVSATSEAELDGMSECCGLCVGLPDVGDSGPLGGWSSPSTSFVGLSGSRELQAVGAGGGGGRTSLAGLRDSVTP